MRIDNLCEKTTPIVIGGATYPASELRLGDLVALDRELARLCDMSGESIDRTREECEAGGFVFPPRFNTIAGFKLLINIFGGQEALIRLTLRKFPRMTAAKAHEINLAMIPKTWDQLWRAAFGLGADGTSGEAMLRFYRYAAVELEPTTEANRLDKAVEEVCRAGRIGFEQLRGMTLTELRLARQVWLLPPDLEDVAFEGRTDDIDDADYWKGENWPGLGNPDMDNA